MKMNWAYKDLNILCPVFPHLFQVNGGIQNQLDKEVLHYDYHASFFDIFVSVNNLTPLHSLAILLLF